MDYTTNQVLPTFNLACPNQVFHTRTHLITVNAASTIEIAQIRYPEKNALVCKILSHPFCSASKNSFSVSSHSYAQVHMFFIQKKLPPYLNCNIAQDA